MITYLQAVKVIEDYATQHYMVQKFGYEFKEQMPNIATKDEKYPMIFVVPVGALATTNTNEFEIDVYCLDRYMQDRTNVNSVVSDTQFILGGLTKWLEEGVTTLDVIHSYPMTPINNDLLDYCGGWVLRLRLEVDMIALCEIPLSGTTPTPAPACEDATQVIEDSLGNQLYSNTIPSGATETQVIQDSTYTVEYTNGTLIESGSILAEGSVVVQVPDPVVCEDVDVFVGEALVGTYSGGTDVFVTVTQDGFDVIPEDVVVTGSAIDIVLADSVPCADTTLEVNGTIEGTVASGSTVDIQLSDSGGVVTPTSVTQVGNDLQVVLPDAAVAPRSTATLMKTGQTTSYRTGDDGDLEVGRATSFLVLDTAPLHNNGAATINTTTNRFTDTLGGSTYANDWVLDWSTWNGSTLLGYYRSAQTAAVWNDAVDNSLGTFGAFVGCRLANIRELMNICHMENGSASFLQYINYAPFSYTGTLWTSTSLYTQPTFAWSLGIGSPGLFVYVGKTTTHKYMPVRTFSLSTSNVLS